MPQLDFISFLFVLFLIAAIMLSCVLRFGFSGKLTIQDGLRFAVVWAVFVTVVLVMNQAGRETIDPGRWPKERLFEPTVKGEILGSEEPVKNLLYGWILFPLRTFPKAEIRADAVLTGAVVFLLAGLFLEILGRLLFRQWRIRWTMTALIGFLLLDLMTFSTIGLVRQIGWIVLS